jgi:hypothetical protein
MYMVENAIMGKIGITQRKEETKNKSFLFPFISLMIRSSM